MRNVVVGTGLWIGALTVGVVQAQPQDAALSRYASIVRELGAVSATPAGASVAGQHEQTSRALAELVRETTDERRRRKLEALQWLIDDARRGGGAARAREAAWVRTFGEVDPTLSADGEKLVADRCAEAVQVPLDRRMGLAAGRRDAEPTSQWLRWTAPARGNFVVLARSDAGDPRLTSFHHCADIASTPIASSDDAFGLDAELLIRAEYAGQPFVLRLDHEGVAATVELGATETAVLSGRVTRESSAEGVSSAYVVAAPVGAPYSYSGSSTYNNGNFSITLWTMSAATPHILRTLVFGHNDTELLHEAWEDSPCVFSNEYSPESCDSPTSVPVSPGDDLAGFDFALSDGATIQGRVLDEVSGEPIPQVSVSIAYDDILVRNVVTDAVGRYRAKGLAAGSYTVFAVGTEHASEAYDDVPCGDAGSCQSIASTPVSIAHLGSARIDFELEPRAYFEVDLQVGGESFHGGAAQFVVRHTNGFTESFYTYSDGAGRFLVGPIEPGVYRVRALLPGIAFGQWYGGVDCATDCAAEMLQAQTVGVEGPGSRPALSFNLKPLPRLSGRLTFPNGALPSQYSTRVALFRPNQVQPAYAIFPDAAGHYEFGGVEPGEYRVLAIAPGFTDELWPDVACEQSNSYSLRECSGAQTIRVDLAAQDFELDFALEAAPSVRGRVLSHGQLSPGGYYAYAPRLLETGLSTVSHNVFVDTQTGSYRISDYQPGSYFVGTAWEGHFPQVAPGLECLYTSHFDNSESACPWAQATVFDLGGGDVNVDFDLRRWGLRVEVKNQFGQALAGVGIDAWNESGLALVSVVTAGDGSALIVPNYWYGQTMRLSTDNYLGYIDQVHRDIECVPGTSVFRGGCTLAGATTVAVSQQPDAPVLRFELRDGITIFRGGFE